MYEYKDEYNNNNLFFFLNDTIINISWRDGETIISKAERLVTLHIFRIIEAYPTPPFTSRRGRTDNNKL